MGLRDLSRQADAVMFARASRDGGFGSGQKKDRIFGMAVLWVSSHLGVYFQFVSVCW